MKEVVRRLLPWMIFAGLIVGTRLPLAPRQLFSFDDVNLAWAVGHFDVRLSQPHPPGYPLFVLQMRVLDRLRFKNARSNLLALALLGSLAAVMLLVRFGNRFFGRDAGWCAAWLLLFDPPFWYAGLTSALRVQLAVVSLAVAAACYRAWCGERSWIFKSAVVLGLCAGVRPELAAMLFPLWLAGVWRSRAGLRAGGVGLGLVVVSVAVWLLPTMFLSGGPKTYLELCWKYLQDQAALTSLAFGAPMPLWQTTIWRMLVWVFVGALGLACPLAVIWGRSPVGLDRSRWLFLALWFGPPFLFALWVHVADAGQVLGMAPPICLLGGILVSRAVDVIEARPSRWHGLIWMLSATALVVGALLARPIVVLALAGVAAACSGWMMRWALVSAHGCPPRQHAFVFLLVPTWLINFWVFLSPVWYYEGPPGALHAALRDVHSGLSFTSLHQVRNTAALDDATLRAIDHLTRRHPRLTVILWECGLTSWRKVAYYYSWWPVVVLDRKRLAGPAPPVVTVWRGSRLEQRLEGRSLEIRLPRGARLIWLLDPKSAFPSEVGRQFDLAQMGPVYFSDLPETSDSRQIGAFRLAW